MATLGEILGGILKDITQSRAAADAVTREYLEVYARDPLLAQLPVPRMTITNVSMTLRFTVDQQRTTTAPDGDRPLGALWGNTLATRMLPALLSQHVRGGGRLANPEALGEAISKAVARTTPDLGAAIRGQPDAAVKASVEAIIGEIDKLPPAQRKLLPGAAQLKTIVEDQVRERLTADLGALRQAATARAAALSDLDVLVKRTDLASAPAGTIQEITLNLTLDDVRLAPEVAAPPPPPPAPEG